MNVSKERACDGKRPYSKRSKVKRMLDGRITSGSDNARDDKVRLTYYKCPYCKYFHVGHRARKAG